jgi:5'-3' exonuclease
MLRIFKESQHHNVQGPIFSFVNKKNNQVEVLNETKNNIFVATLEIDPMLKLANSKNIFLSKKELEEGISAVLKSYPNLINYNFSIEDNFVVDHEEMFKLFMRMQKSNKNFNIYTDNLYIKNVAKAVINYGIKPYKVLIVDLHNFFHLRFYGSKLNEGKYKNEEFLKVPNNLIYSLKSFLEWLFLKSDFQFIFFATESKESWRKKLNTIYEFNFYHQKKVPSSEKSLVYTGKKNNEKPEELLQQIELCEDIIRSLGFPLIKKEGYEADDIIASLVHKLSQVMPETECFIYSSDKDLLQLLEYEKVKILNPRDNKVYDRNNDPALKKFGVPYYHIKNYLALVGDSADGIPGVKNIGPKKAQKILSYLNPGENIFMLFKKADTIQDQKDKELIKYIEENFTEFVLSYNLVNLSKNLLNDKKDSYFYFFEKNNYFLTMQDIDKVFKPYLY